MADGKDTSEEEDTREEEESQDKLGGKQNCKKCCRGDDDGPTAGPSHEEYSDEGVTDMEPQAKKSRGGSKPGSLKGKGKRAYSTPMELCSCIAPGCEKKFSSVNNPQKHVRLFHTDLASTLEYRLMRQKNKWVLKRCKFCFKDISPNNF
jgi:hypothetical protein